MSMANESNLSCFLSKLLSMDRILQQEAIRKLAQSFHNISQDDLKIILRFLNTINESELELKLFSLLSACGTSNANHHETIVLYDPLYEKLETILNRGISIRSTNILYFITSLVYTDDSNCSSARRQLSMHARNMLRVSGCLRQMTTFFMNTMMFPDTWKCLCQCLAECCRDSCLNCDHCAHLIPVCIQKCIQGLMDASNVLNSLLQGPQKNILYFIQSNGLAIFTRDNLQCTGCLELLCTIVQFSEDAVNSLSGTDIYEQITEILEWSGPYSQKGQWCTIILFYINNLKPPLSDSLSSNRHDEERNNKINKVIKCMARDSEANQEDTVQLFQNIRRELFMWKTKEANNKNNNENSNSQVESWNIQRDCRVSTIYRKNSIIPQKDAKTKTVSDDKDNNLSFTFLKDDLSLLTVSKNLKKQNFPYIQKPVRNASQKHIPDPHRIAKIAEKSCQTEITIPGEDNISKLSVFNPAITSTPKRLSSKTAITSNVSLLKSSPTELPSKASCGLSGRMSLKDKRRRLKRVQKRVPISQRSQVTNITKRSMSFFEAVNESCTTFIKSVKGFFTSKRDEADNKPQPISSDNSFMEYMRKRDAAIQGGSFDMNLSVDLNNNKCTTCDDTAMLKRKLASDDNLKMTIKKLKYGINLYGCNFKKISKMFWPKQDYMTPAVLYNLYRKLVLNK